MIDGISMEEAINNINSFIEYYNSGEWNKTGYVDKTELIKKIYFETAEGYDSPTIRTIIDFPSADVQPVRFARWIDLDNRILCSGCDAGYDDSDEVKQNTYIFCPNCGARMDGDNNA